MRKSLAGYYEPDAEGKRPQMPGRGSPCGRTCENARAGPLPTVEAIMRANGWRGCARSASHTTEPDGRGPRP